MAAMRPIFAALAGFRAASAGPTPAPTDPPISILVCTIDASPDHLPPPATVSVPRVR